MKDYLKIVLIPLFVSGSMIICISCSKRNITIKPVTVKAYMISQTGAVSGGNLTNIMLGPISEKGICWGTSADPAFKDNVILKGSGRSNFTCTLTGLQPGSEYFIRAFVISGSDTLYGDNLNFFTEDYGSVTDIDGNVYRTIRIGNRIWMAENLKTTRYGDGKTIPLVKDEEAWSGQSTPGFCWYRNDEEAYGEDFGALYNWYAVNTGLLSPEGWHVATEEDWLDLTISLGGENKAGGKLKQKGYSCWVEPNTGATNEFGFNGLPGGFRYLDGKYYDFGFSSYWWSSDENSEQGAYFRNVYYNDSNIYKFSNDKKNGFSIRCVKDD